MTKLSKRQLAEILRDTPHNFVIDEQNELENGTYFTRLKCFIETLEGSTNEAYYDGIVDPRNRSRFITMSKFNALDEQKRTELEAHATRVNGKKPIVTVGIGLNINAQKVREQYDNLLKQPGLMQDVYDGKKNLTDKQISLIFKDCMQVRLTRLREIYGSDWPKLRVNERICIHSLYFNHPKLAGEDSNFRKHIGKYVETNDVKYLHLAVKAVTEKSNPRKSKGIQNRREAEGTLLASYDCPTFTKPCDDPASRFPLLVHPNETVMPLGLRGSNRQQTNADYFIWCTEMDSKVRADHLSLEGKVFCKNNATLPGDAYNCRCWSEDVPDHILITDKIDEQKAFELYIRTGINIHHLINLESRP